MILSMRTPAEASAALDAACSAVSAILWREREILDRLLYALHCQQFVLTSGAVRWVAASDMQVTEALEAVGECELHRAVETDRLAQLLDLPGEAALGTIASSCDAPWDTLFEDHRDGLAELTAEIAATTAHNRRLLQIGADLVRDTLDRVRSIVPGQQHTSGTTSLLFDRQV